MKWGSMKVDCHEVAVRIEEVCRVWEIRLETFWLSRESKEIEYCDTLSKDVDTSDYWLNRKDFDRLERRYGPFKADYFMSDRSWRMKPFYARFGCGESEGVDAFSISWARGRGYFHPPVGLIWKVVRKAERSRVRGILLVPDWPGSSFYMLIKEKMQEGKMVVKERLRPVMMCPREIVSDIFRGALKFDLIVLSFEF